MIITIDGPAGTGKTTVAKGVADELGFTYFDTGAMYRSVTYGIIKYGIDLNDQKALQAFLDEYPVSIESYFEEKKYFLGSEDVTDKIRTKEVTDLVSKVSSLAPVRNKLVATQRELAHGVYAVFEGRDMGTVVFPQADVKTFLSASLEVRAERRYKELLAKDPRNSTLTQDAVFADIDRRDKLDSSRDLSPLKPASDAIIIDTSNLTAQEVINRIIIIVREKQDKPLTNA